MIYYVLRVIQLIFSNESKLISESDNIQSPSVSMGSVSTDLINCWLNVYPLYLQLQNCGASLDKEGPL